MGYVYIIDTRTGWFKIGRTINPTSRMKNHLKEWPGMEVLATIPCVDYKETEKCIFDHLYQYGYDRQGKRELFIPDKSIKFYILSALFSVKEFCIDVFKEQKYLLENSKI